jgi:dTDP-4-dehydrorhamnose 3,5-epimerase
MNKKVTVKKIAPVFEDERGAIYDLLEVPVRHSGLITFVKGAKRGSHYHKKSTQYTYIIQGRIEVRIKDTKSPDAKVESYLIEKGDLMEIPPLVIHTYQALENSVMLDFTTESRLEDGYETDTIRVDPL